MGEPFTLRRATVEDIDLLVELRDAMWREIAEGTELGDVSEALGNTREYFEDTVPSGEYVCILAEAQARVIGVGGMVIYRKPSQPLSPAGVEGYILNMLTVTGWRGKGVASAIMRELLACARETGAGLVWLRATEAGRHVYEKFGFAENPRYMQLKLEGASSKQPGARGP
jgi:GNAT superfamily N-acetyltransferase